MKAPNEETATMMPEIDELATVVVCEDDQATLDLLAENLEADRYRALAAPTAADALRFCRYGDADLLILDLGLPDAAGLDVLRRIRSSEGAAAEFDAVLPVIVLSGRGADADRVRGLREGAD
ncbi:MAG TPA: response regulator, partial [Solirubrobacterales bacterium]|nr:response regulator [Solirubrobacterales bacterium]